MTIAGRRTEQLDIFCRVTGFTSDFLSFIVVEHIWFFHGALQMLLTINHLSVKRPSNGIALTLLSSCADSCYTEGVPKMQRSTTAVNVNKNLSYR